MSERRVGRVWGGRLVSLGGRAGGEGGRGGGRTGWAIAMGEVQCGAGGGAGTAAVAVVVMVGRVVTRS